MVKNKNNGGGGISLEDVKIPQYDKVIGEIEEKLGNRPSLPKDLEKGEWTEQSLRVLEERYLRKDENGKIIETPDEMCWRVAWDIASAEVLWGATKEETKSVAIDFYKLLVSHDFLPNSPTLMNAGTGNGLQYSACFVLPVEDSLIGIFDAIKYQALIHQTGGGTGFAFSRLRPHGAMVKSSRGTASGPVSFMRIFDAATNEIKQGGKRRGANMGILRVDHPDILEFIHCKEEGGITNFNISVAITDKFMDALAKDEDYELYAPTTDAKGKHTKVVGKLSARKVWDEIADGAWRTGDPGLIFLDRINRGTSNPVPPLGPVESTNPCGEQPLYPYDSCNLGSIFLTYFIKESNGVKSVDWEKLKKVSHLAVRFLDDVIEMNPYPLEPIRRTSLAIRRIGLGVGGWADMLVELGIAYDSEEALKLGEEIMRVIEEEGVKESQDLAKVRGAFPMWPVSIYKDGTPRRNSTVTTIAPTGSISIIAGSSSGIEPLFAISYQHIVKDKHLDRTLTFFNPQFERIAKELGFMTEDIKKKIAEHGVIRDIEAIPEDVRKTFGTAHEIHHDWHIKHQAAFQKYTENAVSKTINMAHGVTVDDIKSSYLLAWKTNCNGVTVFRDGCKEAQVLNLGVKEKVIEEMVEPTRMRPFVVHGATYKLITPVGNAYVTINSTANGDPLEVFINAGKAGSDITAMSDALGRTISAALRFRGSLSPLERAKEIASQLAGIGGRRSVGFGPTKILSLPDAVAMAISTHFGLRVNGFAAAVVGNNSLLDNSANNHLNGKSNGVNGKLHLGDFDLNKTILPGFVGTPSNGVGDSPDGAGAVMSAQFPARQDSALRGDDHTTASVTSDGASAPEPASQLSLDSAQKGKIAGDICPTCGASSFVYEEGCAKCFSCGFSEC